MKNMSCPYCDTPMRVRIAHCPECKVSIEAEFEQSRLSLLPPQDAAFLAEYVLAGFSIKDMEKRVGMSYPAIRARLNRLREKLAEVSPDEQYRRNVLDRLERGEISADDAIQLLG